MVPRYVVAEYENNPWVFIHGDLHNGNIIVDEEYNIKRFVNLCVLLITLPREP